MFFLVTIIGSVDLIKALGVTVSRRFSFTQNIDNVLAACAQSMLALRTLKHHGLPTTRHLPSYSGH